MCLARGKTIPNPPPLSRKGWLAPLSSTRRGGGGLRLPPLCSAIAAPYHRVRRVCRFLHTNLWTWTRPASRLAGKSRCGGPARPNPTTIQAPQKGIPMSRLYRDSAFSKRTRDLSHRFPPCLCVAAQISYIICMGGYKRP